MKPITLHPAASTPGAASMTPHGDQCRCSCGAMLARVVREGLELKCRKCKSVVIITHDELVAMYHALGLQPPPVPASPAPVSPR